MPSDEQFTALGKSPPDITAVGFQTSSITIAVGVDAAGIQAGVIGRCTDGHGVHGISNTVTKAAVFGENLAKGDGVMGKSEDGVGVTGKSEDGTGVHGISNTQAAVFGENLAKGDGVVGAALGNGNGVHGISVTKAAVFGENLAKGVGVMGKSEQGIGVHGISNTVTQAAVFGENVSKGDGVRGVSNQGIGGVFEGKRSPLRLIAQKGSGVPSQDEEHDMGEFHLTEKGELFFCIASGGTTPGFPATWKRVSLIDP